MLIEFLNRFLSRLRQIYWKQCFLIAAILVTLGGPLEGLALLTAICLIICLILLVYCSSTLKQISFAVHTLINVPIRLARNRKLMTIHADLAESLVDIDRIPDPVFQEISQTRLNQIQEQLRQLADGTVVYTNTEAWRTVYDQLLHSSTIHHYKSISWVRDLSYWSHLPAANSLKTNYQLNRSGKLQIERIFILSDMALMDSRFTEPGRFWSTVKAHEESGIDCYIVEESSLPLESQLLCDIGIYGSHVCGEEVVDLEKGNTAFYLYFDLQKVTEFEERWKLLRAYSVRLRDFSFPVS